MDKALNFFKRQTVTRSNSCSQTIFTRNKSATVKDDTFKHVKKRMLLDNFAEDLLNLELDMEQPNVDVKNVHRLLELYANGVEFYESIKSNRYLIFQTKMKNLLLQPNVNEALSRYNQNQTPDEKEQECKEKVKIQEHKELDLNLYLAKQKSTDEDIKYLMEEKKNNLDQINNIIEKEISSQKNMILDRLETRKKNKLEKSLSQPSLFASPQLPRKPENPSNEIKETDEENKETNHLEFESKKRKRKSILMLRKVSNELNNMMEQLNFGNTMKTKKKGSTTEKDNLWKENKLIEDNDGHFRKIEEVFNENPEKQFEEDPEKPVQEEEEKRKQDEKKAEMEERIREVEKHFEEEIGKLEKKMGQSKNSTLISKMIEKTKQEKEKVLSAIINDYHFIK